MSRKGRETLRLRSGQVMGHPGSWRCLKADSSPGLRPVRNDKELLLWEGLLVAARLNGRGRQACLLRHSRQFVAAEELGLLFRSLF
jgi:hypothetical protein